MHSRYTPRLASKLEAMPAHLVTAVRDPYDVFLSYYRWVQTRAAKRAENSKKADNRPRSRMDGRPLDDPEVLAYLAGEFGTLMSRGNGWLHSGRAIPVRYEDLHADPVGTLRRVSDQIQPVDQTAIEAAVAACQIDTVLKARPEMSHTVRTGKVGESRQHLTEAHLQIFRDRWSDMITSLGYPVR
ncbi:MAG: sulfotransferase [Chloroflexia bacterium]|nr:sulfotransferase [Chloroflexia bacterium]